MLCIDVVFEAFMFPQQNKTMTSQVSGGKCFSLSAYLSAKRKSCCISYVFVCVLKMHTCIHAVEYFIYLHHIFTCVSVRRRKTTLKSSVCMVKSMKFKRRINIIYIYLIHYTFRGYISCVKIRICVFSVCNHIKKLLD